MRSASSRPVKERVQSVEFQKTLLRQSPYLKRCLFERTPQEGLSPRPRPKRTNVPQHLLELSAERNRGFNLNKLPTITPKCLIEGRPGVETPGHAFLGHVFFESV